MIRQWLFCLFSFHKEKLQRHWSWCITWDTLKYGQYCFFWWLLLNVLHADTVNHWARTVLQNWPLALPFFSSLAKKLYLDPTLASLQSPYESKTPLEQEGDRHLWAQALPPILSFTLSLLFPPSSFLHLAVLAASVDKSSGESLSTSGAETAQVTWCLYRLIYTTGQHSVCVYVRLSTLFILSFHPPLSRFFFSFPSVAFNLVGASVGWQLIIWLVGKTQAIQNLAKMATSDCFQVFL